MTNFNPQEFAEFMEMWQAYRMFQSMTTQPQPNPVLGTATREQMAQTGAASVSLPTPQEVSQAPQVISATETSYELGNENARLRSQVEQMQAKIAEMQAKMQAQTIELEAAKAESAKAKAELEETRNKLLESVAENEEQQKAIRAVEAYYGQPIEEVRKQLFDKSGDDFYKERANDPEFMKLSNQEKHDAIQKDVGDQWEGLRQADPEEYERRRKETEERKEKRKNRGMTEFTSNNIKPDFGF